MLKDIKTADYIADAYPKSPTSNSQPNFCARLHGV